MLLQFVYTPLLPYELSINTRYAENVPSDLQLCDWIVFTTRPNQSTKERVRPIANFERRVEPLRKCQCMKNSIVITCRLIVPRTFKRSKTAIVHTDYIQRVVDKEERLTNKDAGRQGVCEVIRTKNTGQSFIFELIAAC